MGVLETGRAEIRFCGNTQQRSRARAGVTKELILRWKGCLEKVWVAAGAHVNALIRLACLNKGAVMGPRSVNVAMRGDLTP
jgi:hypothetical protein